MVPFWRCTTRRRRAVSSPSVVLREMVSFDTTKTSSLGAWRGVGAWTASRFMASGGRVVCNAGALARRLPRALRLRRTFESGQMAAARATSRGANRPFSSRSLSVSAPSELDLSPAAPRLGLDHVDVDHLRRLLGEL